MTASEEMTIERRTDLRRRGLLLLLLACGLPGGKAGAGIPSPIILAFEDSMFGVESIKQADVGCPLGLVAYSGGATLFEAPSIAQAVLIKRSVPVGDPPTGWHALAQERLPVPDSWVLRVWVLCGAVGGFELVHQVSALDSTSPKTVIATCPSGKVPIGGGGGLPFIEDEVAIHSLMPTATGWQAAASEVVPTAEDWQLEVMVGCASGVDVDRWTVLTSNAAENWERLELKCEEGRVAIGGGVSLAPGNGFFQSYPAFYSWHVGSTSSGPSGSAWTTAGVVLCYLPPLFADDFESGDTSAWSTP